MKRRLGGLLFGGLLALGLGCTDYDTYRGVDYGRPRGQKPTPNTPELSPGHGETTPTEGVGAMPGSAAVPKNDPFSKAGPPPPAANKGVPGNSGPEGSRNCGGER
jgi:hypothetical protein